MTDNTFTRVDLSTFVHGNIILGTGTERKFVRALRAAYAEIDRLTEECAHWEDKARNWLASPEAARQLEGYRELAGKLAAKDAEIDRLRSQSFGTVACPHCGMIAYDPESLFDEENLGDRTNHVCASCDREITIVREHVPVFSAEVQS